MAISIPDFRADFPQFEDSSTYSDAYIQRALDRAALRIDETAWGNLYDEGQGFLAAHLLAVAALSKSSGGSNTGGLKSVSITDEASMTFSEGASSTKANSGFTSTRYGIEYLELQKLAVIPMHIG